MPPAVHWTWAIVPLFSVALVLVQAHAFWCTTAALFAGRYGTLFTVVDFFPARSLLAPNPAVCYGFVLRKHVNSVACRLGEALDAWFPAHSPK